jgi:hypothetical protein
MALPFEHPKLSVVAALKPNERLAERLEAAIARSAQAHVIDATAVVVSNPEGVAVAVTSPQ